MNYRLPSSLRRWSPIIEEMLPADRPLGNNSPPSFQICRGVGGTLRMRNRRGCREIDDKRAMTEISGDFFVAAAYPITRNGSGRLALAGFTGGRSRAAWRDLRIVSPLPTDCLRNSSAYPSVCKDLAFFPPPGIDPKNLWKECLLFLKRISTSSERNQDRNLRRSA